MKSCAKFDLSFVNIQCTTAFTQKVNLKVQIAVSGEPKSYFNKICRISCVSNHATIAEIANFFEGIVFIGASCRFNCLFM